MEIDYFNAYNFFLILDFQLLLVPVAFCLQSVITNCLAR